MNGLASSRRKIRILLSFGFLVVLSVITIFLRLSPKADELVSNNLATLTVSDVTGQQKIQIPDLYTMRLSEGEHSIESTTPDNRTVWSSLCMNCTNHSPDTYVSGDRITITVPKGAFADLVWWYPTANDYRAFHLMVDCAPAGNCQEGGGHYAYAPSIVKVDNQYHAFYCSAPDNNAGSLGLLDNLRYTTSSDGKTWSTPNVILRPSTALGENGFKSDRSACDPSLVYFDGYYYLYYGTNFETGGGNELTAVEVARSTTIGGPYLKYTKRGTWEESPSDPKHLIDPLVLHNKPTDNFYGSGQPTVIVKDGKLFMWYYDDSAEGGQIYMLESSNPVDWHPDSSHKVALGSYPSLDIKYDSVRKKFMLFDMANSHSAVSTVVVRLSSDGKNWEDPVSLIAPANFPHFSNNIGVSGDNKGWLLPDESVLISFGAPYGFRNDISWAQWNLYGYYYDSNDAILSPDDRVAAASHTATPTPTAVAPANANPIGYLDFADTHKVYGWALDPDTPDKSIRVDLYLDNPYGAGGIFIGNVVADSPSPDVTNVTKYQGNHRFVFTVPGQFLDGKEHKIFAYGIDSSGTNGANTLLSYSGKDRFVLGSAPVVLSTSSPSAITSPPNTTSVIPPPTVSINAPTTPVQLTESPRCWFWGIICATSVTHQSAIPTTRATISPKVTKQAPARKCRRILFFTWCKKK